MTILTSARINLLVCTTAAVLPCARGALAQNAVPQARGEWIAYGRDASGNRFSPLSQITRENVNGLDVAWTYRTGDTTHTRQPAKFEATPLMVDGTLYLSTPFARVIALDARTGAVCNQFGDNGVISLEDGLRNAPAYKEEYELTSPPAVINGLIVAGSGVADNKRTNAASGEVRAYDARTGAQRWSWDPVPRDSTDAARRQAVHCRLRWWRRRMGKGRLRRGFRAPLSIRGRRRPWPCGRPTS